eukprot:2233498-Alexandrium_andersonii.AAC.1
MSASLVGSEMCIRDRGRPNQLGNQDRSAGRRRQARPLGQPQKGRSMSSTTVSYTHLTLPTICSV